MPENDKFPPPVNPITKAKLVELNKTGNLPPDWKTVVSEPFTKINKVTDNLYLTSFLGLSVEAIDDYKIKTVINVTDEMPSLKGMDVVRVPVKDERTADLYPYFSRTADLIHEAINKGNSVAVHCVAGVSRSASMVIAYLIKYKKMTLREAYYVTVKARPISRPNASFLQQLIRFEAKYHKTPSTRIIRVKKNGVTLDCPDFLGLDFPDKLEADLKKGGGINAPVEGEGEDIPIVDLDLDKKWFKNNVRPLKKPQTGWFGLW